MYTYLNMYTFKHNRICILMNNVGIYININICVYISRNEYPHEHNIVFVISILFLCWNFGQLDTILEGIYKYISGRRLTLFFFQSPMALQSMLSVWLQQSLLAIPCSNVFVLNDSVSGDQLLLIHKSNYLRCETRVV